MVSKKYTLLAILLLTLGVTSYAQTTSWDWKDSSVVPVKSITQYNEFMHNTNPFPAKPRNAWELGLGGGLSFISGDVQAKLGIGGSITARKAINNLFSYRIWYFGSINYGKGAVNNYNSIPWFVNNPSTSHSYVTTDYINYTHTIAFDLIASLNTFSNYRGDPIANVYLLGGLGVTASGVKDKAGVNGRYEWVDVFPKKGIIGKISHSAILISYGLGGGFAYKINKKYNIGVEERLSIPLNKYSYADGFSAGTGTNDIFYFTAFKLNINMF